jgi:hypothetical protein
MKIYITTVEHGVKVMVFFSKEKFLAEYPEARITEIETKDEPVQLLRDSALLSALENGGVDNWQGYDDSLEMFYVDPFPEEE